MGGLCFEEEYRLLCWRLLEEFSSSHVWCFVWHLVAHGTLPLSHANTSYYQECYGPDSIPWKPCILIAWHILPVTCDLLSHVHNSLKGSTAKQALLQHPRSRWRRRVRAGNRPVSELCLSVPAPLYHLFIRHSRTFGMTWSTCLVLKSWLSLFMLILSFTKSLFSRKEIRKWNQAHLITVLGTLGVDIFATAHCPKRLQCIANWLQGNFA